MRILRSDDDGDSLLTLAAILLLLQQEHPAQAAFYALLANEVAADAQQAVALYAQSVKQALEKAANQAAAEAAATGARFEDVFLAKLEEVLPSKLSKLEAILGDLVMGNVNAGWYGSGAFGPGTYWAFRTKNDEKVCENCTELRGRVFAWDDVAGRYCLPLTHYGDRCWAEPLGSDYTGSVDEGVDYLEFVNPDFQWDKAPGGLMRMAA